MISYSTERQLYREKLGELLGEKVICIAEAMGRHDYLPKSPNQSLLDTVFDVSFPDVQPYLFKVRERNFNTGAFLKAGLWLRLRLHFVNPF